MNIIITLVVLGLCFKFENKFDAQFEGLDLW